MSLAPWSWRPPEPLPPTPKEDIELVRGLSDNRDQDCLHVLADFAEERGWPEDAEIFRTGGNEAEALRDVYWELANQ